MKSLKQHKIVKAARKAKRTGRSVKAWVATEEIGVSLGRSVARVCEYEVSGDGLLTEFHPVHTDGEKTYPAYEVRRRFMF